MIYVALALSGFALVLAVGAIALAFLAARRAADTSGELTRHRHSHALDRGEDPRARRHGATARRPEPAPPVEDDDGPPTGEHYPPTSAIPAVPRPGQLRSDR